MFLVLLHGFEITLPWLMGGLMLFFLIVYALGFKGKSFRFLAVHRVAPSVMTALGLLGTFIGLTLAFGNLPNNFGADPQTAAKGLESIVSKLKDVFQYSLWGIFSAIVFMLLSSLLNDKQRKKAKEIQEKQRSSAINNAALYQETQSTLTKVIADELKSQSPNLVKTNNQLSILNDRMIDQADILDNASTTLKLAADGLSVLGQGFDTKEIAKAVSEGVVTSMTPIFERIEASLAKNSGELIQQALIQMREEVLLPLADAVQRTNTNTECLVNAVTIATTSMTQSAEKMTALTEKIGVTVSQMEVFQLKLLSDMQQSQVQLAGILSGFNISLNQSISQIQPAIEQGMNTASVAMTTQINHATTNMSESVRAVMAESSQQTRQTLALIFQQFGDSQLNLQKLFEAFSQGIEQQLSSMVSLIQTTGQQAQQLMQNAATNLECTLGDIDTKLLNTQKELEVALERFRKEYSLRLEEFFNEQNSQLEQTIGAQRQGLVRVVDQINVAFEQATAQQEQTNQGIAHNLQDVLNVQTMITRLQGAITGAEAGVLTKVELIALGLAEATQHFEHSLSGSAKELQRVNSALNELGNQLPSSFTLAFEVLNKQYTHAFTDMDEGISKVAGRLQVATSTLATAMAAFSAVQESR